MMVLGSRLLLDTRSASVRMCKLDARKTCVVHRESMPDYNQSPSCRLNEDLNVRGSFDRHPEWWGEEAVALEVEASLKEEVYRRGTKWTISCFGGEERPQARGDSWWARRVQDRSRAIPTSGRGVARLLLLSVEGFECAAGGPDNNSATLCRVAVLNVLPFS